jgi:hypothetical protein
MTSACSGSGTKGPSSSQPSSSSVIGSIYSNQILIQSTTNPAKVIKKYGLFQFEEDATTPRGTYLLPSISHQPPTYYQNSRIIYLGYWEKILLLQMNT